MNKVLLVLFSSVFLVACGGGGNSDTTDTSTGSNIQGDWITQCVTRTNGSSRIATTTFNKLDDGTDAFFYGQVSFDTSNCSGESSIVVLGGPVTYSGEHTTSNCIAEKIDQEILLITDGDTTIDGAELNQFLMDNQLPDTIYDIACPFNNQLLVGLVTASLDGRSSSKRPVEMNTSVPFNVWAEGPSSREVSNKNNSLEYNMKRISQKIHSTLK